MELIYIWIKDYKNIQNQGFNFSHRWRFDYDTDNCILDMEDRKDTVIDNFFGEHIVNVTAIVGENGVGKSNLLGFIMNRLKGGFWENQFILVFFDNTTIKIWHHSGTNHKFLTI